MKCKKCGQKVEPIRIDKDGLGIWAISCCGVACESPSLNAVVELWDALEHDSEYWPSSCL